MGKTNFCKNLIMLKKRLFYVCLHHQLEVTDLSCAPTEWPSSRQLYLKLNPLLNLKPFFSLFESCFESWFKSLFPFSGGLI